MEFDELPPHVQEAITRREAYTSPFDNAIEALSFTWEIAGGNLDEIDRALKVWEGEGWREIHNDVVSKHWYHRELIRQFHNFLSSAISAVWHSKRIAVRLRNVAPELAEGFTSRLAPVAESDAFVLLEQLRDYAIHTGHHLTTLVLQAAITPTGDTLVGTVCFEVEGLRRHLQTELQRARTSRKREELHRLLGSLDTMNE